MRRSTREELGEKHRRQQGGIRRVFCLYIISINNIEAKYGNYPEVTILDQSRLNGNPSKKKLSQSLVPHAGTSSRSSWKCQLKVETTNGNYEEFRIENRSKASKCGSISSDLFRSVKSLGYRKKAESRVEKGHQRRPLRSLLSLLSLVYQINSARASDTRKYSPKV